MLQTRVNAICIGRMLATQPNTNLQYCFEHVRKFDYENFVSACLYPSNIRSAAFAIRAFNVEIAQIRDNVSDRKTGKFRIQFWIDAIEHIYNDTPPKTPIALELHRAMKRHSLSKQHFMNIIQARAEVLNDFPFKDVQHLSQYCERTTGAILYLFLQCLGSSDSSIEETARHIGQTQGIVTLLRGIPYNTLRGHVYLPMDIMKEHKVSPGLMGKWTGQKDDRVQRVIHDLVEIADDHLAQALSTDVKQKVLPLSLAVGWRQEGHPAVKNPRLKIVSDDDSQICLWRQANPTYLRKMPLNVVCREYLRSLKAHNYYVFHPKLQRRNHLLPLRLFLRSFRRSL